MHTQHIDTFLQLTTTEAPPISGTASLANGTLEVTTFISVLKSLNHKPLGFLSIWFMNSEIDRFH